MNAPIAQGLPSNRALYVLIAGLLIASIAVQVVRDRGWQPYYPEDPPMWISSGPMASRLALGFDAFVSDVYWMRAVVYYGGKRREGKRSYANLAPLLQLVTTLDPHFRVAYRFGAIFLAEGYPDGPARPDLSVELLRQGIERDAPRWDYFHDIGFVYYWWLRDYEQAAEWFAKGAEQPGAPEWLRPLAATTLAVGGDRGSSRTLWTQLRDHSDSEWIRQNAEHRLKQLDAMEAIAQLTQVINRFHDAHGRYPQDWREVAQAERWRGIPADSTGVPFTLDPATGGIDVSNKSVLWPLPRPESTPASVPK